MHETNLAALDLNLLVALDALLRERHVTRAARRVGLSQPAMSHALSRLRDVLSDPLLVRGSGAMLPTERALALEAPLRAHLEGLAELLGSPETFDPARARGTMTVVCEDYMTMLLLPRVMKRAAAEAPGIAFDVIPRPADLYPRLEDGGIDIAIGVFSAAPAATVVRSLLEDELACVVRKDHPRIRRRLTLRQYVAASHVRIGVGSRGPSSVDDALAALGHERRVALRVGSFLAAPLIVAETDHILTLPGRLAESVARRADLAVHRPPFELPTFTLQLIWHRRKHEDGAHRWLRDLIAEEGGAL